MHNGVNKSGTGTSPVMRNVGRLYCFLGKMFFYCEMLKGDRWYSVVLLIGTPEEASSYKSETTLIATNGIEYIKEVHLVRSYAEDLNSIFNERNCFYLNKAAIKKFVDGNKIKLSLVLKKTDI